VNPGTGQKMLVSFRTSEHHGRPQGPRNYLLGQNSFRMRFSQGSTKGNRRRLGCLCHWFPSWTQNHHRHSHYLGQSLIGRWRSRVSNEGLPNPQVYRNQIGGSQEKLKFC
jgi:hypothetical protein